MSQQELLKKVVEALERAGIEYMVTGSVASSLQGEPRSTHDIDVVVAIQAHSVQALLKAFPPPVFYLDETDVREAIADRTMFNLLDSSEGNKVDFWLFTDEPFDRSRFSRVTEVEMFGKRIHVSSAEDTILAKLRWALMSGGSEKQFLDALRVYEVQAAKLDLRYLEEWADRLGVRALWDRVKREAEKV